MFKIKIKTCIICGDPFYSMKYNHKYCGSQKEESTCAWKASKLQAKLTTIKERCLNPEHQNYKRYKNIKIYKPWLKNSFLFVKWALSNGWEPQLQIDRKKNLKGYTPSNCHFVTASENCRNKINRKTFWEKQKRECRVCKKTKSFSEFAVSRKEVGGIAYECKICRKAIDKKRWDKYYRAKGIPKRKFTKKGV